ncbi:MAG: T9SS type A sorting domain-containing protein [Saprospiraceae bacterium]|nr:T9SS type A sorting domain-containing protein [Saprospiraceae bacterium]
MRILILIFMFTQFTLVAQDYFYISNNNFGRTAANYQCLNHENRVFTFTSRLCEFTECGTVSEVDVLGNIKWTLELPNTDLAPQSSCIFNDTLYVSGNYSPGEGITCLHKISLDGKLRNSFLFSDPNKRINRSLILDLCRFKDKFIISGQGFINEESKGIIISINGLSMKLDTIVIDDSKEFTILEDNFIGSDSLLTCFYKVNKKLWPDQVRRIVKYDTNFNQVWSYTSDTLGRNPSFPRGTVLRDGRITLVDFRPGWPTGLNALRCLDTITKQTSWMYSYPFIQSWGRYLLSVKQLRNGDIICTGEYTTKATEPRIEGSPYMMRLDINGNLLWEHAYIEIAPDGEDKGGNLWDVIELDNGDLMAVGFVTNNNKWDPLIIRTDHRGCMDGGSTNCPTVRIIDLSSGAEDEITVHNNKKISIYPNPTDQQSFTIDMSDFDDNTQYLYSILDIYGKVISQNRISHREQSIDLHNIVTGIYIVKITNGDIMVHVEKLMVK